MSSKIKVALKVGIIQVNPQIGEVEKTVARVWNALEELEKKLNYDESLYPDLLVFPEFSLIGYHFESKEQIRPYAATGDMKNGPSYELAAKISKKFNCYTVIGMPEIYIDHNDNDREIFYNSSLMVNKEGEILYRYRKSFLYTQDYKWGCEENPEGYQNFDLEFKGKGTNLTTGEKNIDVTLKTGLGLCMDMSPYKFKSPFHDYEYSTWHLDHGTELMIFSMCWLHSSAFSEMSEQTAEEVIEDIEENLKLRNLPPIGSQGDFTFNLDNDDDIERIANPNTTKISYTNLKEPDMQNINYWILRFSPFVSMNIRQEVFDSGLVESQLNKPSQIRRSSYIGCTIEKPWGFEDKQAILLLANRCGIEQKCKVFAGSSNIMKFNGKYQETAYGMDSTNESVELLGGLTLGYEGILLRDVNITVNR
ncbi:hypothetical protein TPHA_0O01060 [Tetrapisispora phaffii CBS 4417]|uniref:CN hydrolase domain-containing protein n=1 Tax=Tetrapisispora phaffii (strain ATCC 24235 / CBS 4417 / NBRC 1672 / NRRL Y-8282 / UCD 70-5) TaxID=1071381 RepID=G8C1P7_TETPH|nr:hypothetical protein TPHA_0O01060 [Tetrapisispora phaffii CBS 4417]CCE66075.1 hypothetical protein TPHA_0O01060 [Tetrapisispora phaffii CBS 4417]